jgi:bifunctional non-homologous end joining protein LigD
MATIPAAIKKLIAKGKKSAIPARVSPMLCTLTKEVLDSDEYLYELKWDGYRIVSYSDGKKIRMDSRSGLDYTSKYPPVAAALKALRHKVVLDGEVVVFNEQGMPDFDALQKYNGHDTPISYCVFDILWLDGYSLMELPLVERKQILQALLKGNDVLRYSVSYDDGPALYEQTLQMNLEGIVAKRKDSSYNTGERGYNWLKTPTRKQQEFVIGGYAESDKARSFRSLLFGAYNAKGELEWIGRSGGGYKEKEMPGILAKLKKLEVKESPFVNKVLDTKGAKIHYVQPELVANFEFATWTKSGRIRKPATFLGFRKDKNPRQVVREVPKDIETVEKEKPAAKKKSTVSPASNWRVLDAAKVTSQDTIEIEGNTVELINVEREVWPGVPKAELIKYYHTIAPYILPYLQDRPLSLHLKLKGAMAPGMYIKDMEGRQPEYGELYSMKRKHKAKGKREQIDYLVCNNEATLLYVVNLGAIDINPWTSRTSSPEQPDYIVIDLDPSDDDFTKAIRAAKAAEKVMKQYKLKTFVKTSGKTGIHIYIPCRGIDYARARDIAEALCKEIEALEPDITTTEVSIDKRGDKLYLDPNQNDFADTVAAPYSVRPAKHPTVSTPLEWKEINAKLDMAAFTIDTIVDRLETKGDPWANLMDEKVAKANSKILAGL